MAVVRRFPLDRTVGIILLVGLVHGLLYVFLVPPWQHYDEPTHFEYAWLVANRTNLPKYGDYDQSMRRRVAGSMLEHGFFDRLSFRPDLLSKEPIWIGFSELAHPPAYYLLVSLPLRFLRFADITLELYIARTVSLFLYLASILAACGILAELVPRDHALRWMVPTTLALLPGFADLMTSVNNDVGAAAVFSLFLWGCIYIVRRGFSLLGLLWVLATAVIGLLTKTTVAVALPLSMLSFLFSVARDRRRWLAWALTLGGVLVAVFATLTWSDAALWYRNTLQSVPTRVASSQAPLGTYAIQLEILPTSQRVPVIRQFLPLDQVAMLSGKAVTVGAWMWADLAIQGQTPVLRFSVNRQSQAQRKNIAIETSPKFFAFSTNIPDNAATISVDLEQLGQATEKNVTVFYNGMVLVEGIRPTNEPPQFDDSFGTGGKWAGVPFRNLLRNASATDAWFSIQPWADRLGLSLRVDQFSVILGSVIDWQGAGWYYWATSQRLFRTFWATFGWGGVFLRGSRPYFILWIFTLAAGIGVLVALWNKRHAVAWDVLFLLAMAMIGTWGSALIRGLSQSLLGATYIPVARYAYPVIIPTVLLLNVGWLEISRSVQKWIRIPGRALAALYVGLFLALDAWSLFSLSNYFYGG